MQITKKDQKLLIVLACVLLLAGGYKFGYRNYGDKRAAIEEEIVALQARYDDLSSKEVNRAKYEKGTKENQEKITKILATYPSKLEHENEIYFTKLLEDSAGIKVSQMSYLEPEVFYNGEEQETKNDMKVSQATSTLTIESDYSQFKRVLSFIEKSDSRKVIQNINLSFDNKTGILSGTVAFNSFSLTGADTVYKPFNIPSEAGGQGVPELFGGMASK